MFLGDRIRRLCVSDRGKASLHTRDVYDIPFESFGSVERRQVHGVGIDRRRLVGSGLERFDERLHRCVGIDGEMVSPEADEALDDAPAVVGTFCAFDFVVRKIVAGAHPLREVVERGREVRSAILEIVDRVLDLRAFQELGIGAGVGRYAGLGVNSPSPD